MNMKMVRELLNLKPGRRSGPIVIKIRKDAKKAEKELKKVANRVA